MKRKDVPLAIKLRYLSMALTEIADQRLSLNYKTDVIGIACQYSSSPKLKREDFKDIMKMSLGEIIKEVCKDRKLPKLEESEETIALTVNEVKTLMDDAERQIGWSDTSYRIIRFIGDDPSAGV